MNAKKLTSISNYDGLREVGVRAFQGAEFFTTCDFVPNLEVISERAFEKTKVGPTIVIGDKLDRLGQYAFAKASSISEVIFKGYRGTEIGRFAFNELPLLKTIKVSADYAPKLESIKSSFGAQLEDFGWYQFANAGSSAVNKKVLVSVGTLGGYLRTSGETSGPSTYVPSEEASWVYLRDKFGFDFEEALPLTGVCDVEIFVGGTEYTNTVYADSSLGHLVGPNSSVYVSEYVDGSFMFDLEGLYDNEEIRIYSDAGKANLLGTFRPRISSDVYTVGEALMSATRGMKLSASVPENGDAEMAEITKAEYEALVSRVNQMVKIIKRLSK